jgi:hypothetical protein
VRAELSSPILILALPFVLTLRLDVPGWGHRRSLRGGGYEKKFCPLRGDGDGHPVPVGITSSWNSKISLPYSKRSRRSTSDMLFTIFDSQLMMFVLDVRGRNVMLLIHTCFASN